MNQRQMKDQCPSTLIFLNLTRGHLTAEVKVGFLVVGDWPALDGDQSTPICPSGFLQFQTDYGKTAAESAADRRFLFVDLPLVIICRDVPRTVW